MREALQSDGLVITDDPLRLKSGKVEVEIDLGAERILAAEKDGRRIAVEVKNFLNRSPVTDFEDAYGQFMLYRRILKKEDPERMLYLAVPQFAFETFFQRPLIQEILQEEKMHLLIFDHKENTVVLWKNW